MSGRCWCGQTLPPSSNLIEFECTAMLNWPAILATVEIPGSGLNSAPPRAPLSRMSPVFIILAVFAIALVAYLAWDFLRQKRVEKKERERLERFRENKMKESSGHFRSQAARRNT